MSTPSGYPGPGNDPYGYQPPVQYPSQPYGAPGYPPAGAFGAGPVARPGVVTGAAVLAFVVGGLGILAGLLELIAGGLIGTFIGSLGAVITILSVVSLAVGGVYIWAGVQALTGKNAKILTIVAIVHIALQILLMIVLFGTLSLIGLAVSVAIIALLLQQPSKDWFRANGVPTF